MRRAESPFTAITGGCRGEVASFGITRLNGEVRNWGIARVTGVAVVHGIHR